ncbi:hypothetical protein [Phytoactinopolyspora limicola]|uniref:hypothetical protein n=1 Tax=Phytoactinopolyspora limicola TaxID=2715536 RepID=UPI00140C1566|nr:hypothetical protein [Phytoactinopolyspora limicola]
MATNTQTGSQLVAALENVWNAIQANHPEIPDVVIITGSGRGNMSLVWGHYGHDFWVNGRFRVSPDGTVERDRKPELFVSGETLGVGAEKTLQTLLHEATHALAAVRGIKDTSRQNRYHNNRFRGLAEELGLEYAADRPHKVLGFSSVTITDETREAYSGVIEALDAAIALTMDLPEWARITGLGGTNPPTGGGWGVDGGDAGRVKRPTTRKPGGLIKATCSCGRNIRVARSTLNVAPITCGECGGDFTVDA